MPVPATRRPRTLLPRVQSCIRDHICCFASRLLCEPGEPELYTRPSLPCFTKMPLCHWSSDSASTNITDVQSQILNAPPLVKSPAAPVIAPQCPESASTSVTTTLDPTVRTKFHFCNHYRASEHFPIILCVSCTVTHSSPTPCAAPLRHSERAACRRLRSGRQTVAELLLNSLRGEQSLLSSAYTAAASLRPEPPSQLSASSAENSTSLSCVCITGQQKGARKS